LRSQALYLVTKRVNFLSESRVLRFPRIGATQFFQRFLNGEFGCFGHDKASYPSDGHSDNRTDVPDACLSATSPLRSALRARRVLSEPGSGDRAGGQISPPIVRIHRVVAGIIALVTVRRIIVLSIAPTIVAPP
jgi:hypothetical protein